MKMDLKKDYSTHMPMLIKVAQISDGPILEIGSGIFSTPVLHWLCSGQRRKLVTYENNPEYYKFAKKFKSRNHSVRFVKTWDEMDIMGTHWGMVLIDHDPTSRRGIDLVRLKDNADYFVLHDSEPERDRRQKFDKAWPLFKYRYDWKGCKPYTTVVSNFKDLSNFSEGNESMLGKWDGRYKDVKNTEPIMYGSDETYKLAAKFLSDIDEVEDWGCGAGGFRKFYKGKYIGINGSANPFVDKVADLRAYRSNAGGIVMRHVLEHNYDWKKVLHNAIASFQKKLCLILFTPFVAETLEISHNKKHGVDVPDISFSRKDIEKFFAGLDWRLDDNIKTKTQYGIEHVYYVEKPTS